jgi:hypothetical protein
MNQEKFDVFKAATGHKKELHFHRSVERLQIQDCSRKQSPH